MGNQNKKLESGHYTFWKCCKQGAPQRKQYHFFFPETPKISRKIDFGLIVAYWNKNARIRNTINYEILTYSVLQEKSNKTASFAEHLKFQE